MKESTQLLAVVDNDIARRFKAKLALEGLTYKAWLSEAMDAYLAKQPRAKKRKVEK